MREIFGPTIKFNEAARSARNPYVDRVTDNKELPILSLDEMHSVKGNWHQQQKDTHYSLILEIGCHNGETLSTLAKTHPDDFFIGMDITYKRVYTSAQKAHKSSLNNVRTVLSDARHLEKIFAPQELDGVMIFFPDPWPKMKHRKHRLVNQSFAQMLLPLLKPEGFVWFKSDSLDYYAQAFSGFQQSGYSMDKGKHPALSTKIRTTFEKKFLNQQITTYEFHCTN